jgi:hypothetical protein
MNGFNYHELRSYIEDAVANYEKSAPQLAEWLDELYIALEQNPISVSVFELLQLAQLKMDGIWEQANYAQNRWYKVRALKGQDRGVLSY